MTVGVGELDRHFNDIESYVSLNPNDQNVRQASINMVASILKACEDVIGYYIQNKGWLLIIVMAPANIGS